MKHQNEKKSVCAKSVKLVSHPAQQFQNFLPNRGESESIPVPVLPIGLR